MANFRTEYRDITEGCFACEEKFGTTITNSDGKKVPVRLIGTTHNRRPGFIPKMSDWFENPSRQVDDEGGYLKTE